MTTDCSLIFKATPPSIQRAHGKTLWWQKGKKDWQGRYLWERPRKQTTGLTRFVARCTWFWSEPHLTSFFFLCLWGFFFWEDSCPSVCGFYFYFYFLWFWLRLKRQDTGYQQWNRYPQGAKLEGGKGTVRNSACFCSHSSLAFIITCPAGSMGEPYLKCIPVNRLITSASPIWCGNILINDALVCVLPVPSTDMLPLRVSTVVFSQRNPSPAQASLKWGDAEGQESGVEAHLTEWLLGGRSRLWGLGTETVKGSLTAY